MERTTEFTDASLRELLDLLRVAAPALRAAGDLRSAERAMSMQAHLLLHYYAQWLIGREEYPRAIEALHEVIPLKQELGELAAVARAFGQLGYAQQNVGDLTGALASHREAERLFRELSGTSGANAIDAADGLVMALGNQTMILERLIDQALRCAREALELARVNGFSTAERLARRVATLESQITV